jgi:soluble lytic murein transglycosylase-like protein
MLRPVLFALCVAGVVPGCSSTVERTSEETVSTVSTRNLYPNETPELREMIVAAAQENEVPVSLVQRVVIRESTHRPEARNGPYYGLMQILPATARSMGFRGEPSDLLDAETNLRYAVRYLRGAWLVSDGDEEEAVMGYARGYYYEAKRLGLLDETGAHGRKDWSE